MTHIIHNNTQFDLIQEPFISDNGTQYTAFAENNNREQLQVIWNVKQYYIDNPEELDDDSNACDWDKYTIVEL